MNPQCTLTEVQQVLQRGPALTAIKIQGMGNNNVGYMKQSQMPDFQFVLPNLWSGNGIVDTDSTANPRSWLDSEQRGKRRVRAIYMQKR